ncbi:hypothetical protein [Agromyces sp. Marseille-P2726]|uniref:hypothetical protein n=1 Tax=Agromyces sp. Marseille-P2726 TaxID=2709132 RepID=UPI0015705808|nr:hypothetical protein [Agromyces sp. Marseille-P2726]
MSTDEQVRDEPVADEQPGAEVLDALRDIESKPLADRADGYRALAERLRSELEHSDPGHELG